MLARGWRWAAVGLAVLAAASCGVFGQEILPAASAAKFEVATIKPRKDMRPLLSIDRSFLYGAGKNSEHGLFELRGVSLEVLIELAYDVNDFQVLESPSWANSDRYDVVAKAEGDVGFEQMRPMLQSLLAERFKVTLQRETRQLPVYELEIAKGGFKLAAMKEGSCIGRSSDNPPMPPKPGGPASINICGGVRMMMLGPEKGKLIEAKGISMTKLAELLSDEVGVTVVDKTGFTEAADVHLQFAPGEAVIGGVGSAADSPPPALFTALQEQLGLRLKSARGPVEVVVVERAERPTEN